MSTERTFRPKRIALLIRNAILLSVSSIAIVSAALGGVLLVVSALDAWGSGRPGLHRYLYLFVLFNGGLILTSRSYRELHDPLQGLSWLLLPASLLEKTLARIALTTLVLVAGSMLLYLVFSVVSEGLNLLLFDRRHPLFFPFDPLVLKGVLLYMAIQAPFLLGAVYFRKHALSKTVLSLLGFLLLLALGILLGARLILGSPFGTMNAEALLDAADPGAVWMRLGRIGSAAGIAGKTVLLGVMPLICWATCYFRLKETER